VLPHHASPFVRDYGATGRCHERRYLFRFAKYRDMYRKYLFAATQRFDVEWVGRTADTNEMKRYDIVDANETWLEDVKSFFLRAKNLS